ncbi:MAG TPA: heavy-metal-associated domain-containing protein [Rubrivivax sp.]
MFELTIPTMTCGHCVGVVTTAIEHLDPMAKVEIDLPSHRVRVDTSRDRKAVEAVLAEAGYVPA